MTADVLTGETVTTTDATAGGTTDDVTTEGTITTTEVTANVMTEGPSPL